jgi:hypothetical protein
MKYQEAFDNFINNRFLKHTTLEVMKVEDLRRHAYL